MANMSYCRFRNTLLDFEDCLKEIEEENNGSIIETMKNLSHEEKRAFKDLITAAEALVEFSEQEQWRD